MPRRQEEKGEVGSAVGGMKLYDREQCKKGSQGAINVYR